jgi:toxin-antitoxin system PIN domain toxin
VTRSLLDINVLLALLDNDHVDHRRAGDWLDAEIGSGWASCAITQNGFVRIVSQPRYPSPVPPAQAIQLLEQACSTEHHEFWPCEISVLDEASVDRSRVHGPRQVTDAYLLALATHHGGRFVTFDRSVPLSAVPAATSANLTILD